MMTTSKADVTSALQAFIEAGGSVLCRRLRGEAVKITASSLREVQPELVAASPDPVTAQRMTVALISHLRENLRTEELRILNVDLIHAYKSHPNPFEDRAIECVRHLSALRDACLRFAPADLSRDEQIGQLLLAAMVWDGIGSKQVLEALYRQRAEPLNQLPDRSFYLDLRMAHDSNMRVAVWRWRPSVFTSILHLGLKPDHTSDPRHDPGERDSMRSDADVSHPPHRTDWQRARACVKAYLKRSWPDLAAEPADILAGVGVWLAADGCELARQFASREVIGHAVKESALLRLHGIIPPMAKRPREFDRNNSRAVSVPLASDEACQAISPSALQIFSGLFRSTIKAEVIAALHEAKANTPSDDQSVLGIMIGFATYLLSSNPATGQAYSVSTVRRYVPLAVGLFLSATVSERIVGLDLETYGEIYEAVRESVDCDRQRSEIARLLVTFHRFLVASYGVPPLDITADGDWASALNPVDSNVISIDEYERSLDLIEDDPRALENPDAYAISRILIILAFRCGMRRMEVLGLRIGDVHLSDRTVIRVVPNQYRRLKSTASRRVVPVWLLLSPEELEFLTWWAKERLSIADGNLQAPLMTFRGRGTSLPDSDDLMQIALQAVRRATGDPRVRFHGLRHSCATWLFYAINFVSRDGWGGRFSHLPKTASWLGRASEIRAGLLGADGPDSRGAWAVMGILGHASPSTSLAHYIHAVEWIHHDCVSAVPLPGNSAIARVSGLSIKQIENAKSRGGAWQIPLMFAKANPHRRVILTPHHQEVSAGDDSSFSRERPVGQETQFLKLYFRGVSLQDSARLSNISESRAAIVLDVRQRLAAAILKHRAAMRGVTPIDEAFLHGVLLPPKNKQDIAVAEWALNQCVDRFLANRRHLLKVLASYFRCRRQDSSIVFTSPDHPRAATILIEFLCDLGVSAEDLHFSRQKGAARPGVRKRWMKALPIVARARLEERSLTSSLSASARENWLGVHPVMRMGDHVTSNRAVHYLMEMLYLHYRLSAFPDETT